MRSKEKTKNDLQVSPNIIVENKIFIIRGQKVMLDSDLAEIYGVKTKALNQGVKRNTDRFPADFMFQLKKEEFESLRSQFVTGSQKHRDTRYLPHVFTEHGVAMLSSVLNSPRAVQMNIYIIRAFIKMREMLLMDKMLELRILKLETKSEKQKEDIESIISILRRLSGTSIKPLGPIGFQSISK